MVLRLLKDVFADNCPDSNFLGNGHSAVVFDAALWDNSMFMHLFTCMRGGIVASLDVQKPALIKFSIVRDSQQYEGSIRENTIHRYLSLTQVVVKSTTLSISRNIPRFFFSGYLPGFYVTVMQNMHGYVSLQQHLSSDQLTADDYVNIEWMLYRLWCLSVAHADVHLRNLMWHPRLRQVVLIDFGNAMFLPPSIVARLHEAFHPHNDAISTWFQNLSTYVRAVIGSRGHTGFQADGHMLRHIRNVVADQHNIQSSRCKLRDAT